MPRCLPSTKALPSNKSEVVCFVKMFFKYSSFSNHDYDSSSAGIRKVKLQIRRRISRRHTNGNQLFLLNFIPTNPYLDLNQKSANSYKPVEMMRQLAVSKFQEQSTCGLAWKLGWNSNTLCLNPTTYYYRPLLYSSIQSRISFQSALSCSPRKSSRV